MRRGRWRSCAASTSRSRPASAWRSSARRAPASRRCCTSWAGWTGRTPARSWSAGVPWRTSPPAELAAFRNRTIGFVFQFQQLLADFTALENVMIPGRIAGHPGGRARRCARARLLAQVGHGGARGRTFRRSSRAASSSGWRSAAPCCSIRRCCSPTSPPGSLDPESGAAVVELLRDPAERPRNDRDRGHPQSGAGAAV